MTKTAKIYGDSLYDLAAEEKLTEEILPQMEQVAVLFKENPDYLTLPSEPLRMPRWEKSRCLAEWEECKVCTDTFLPRTR